MTKNENGIFEVYPATPYRYKMVAAKDLVINSHVIINGCRCTIMSNTSGYSRIDKIYGKEICIVYMNNSGNFNCFTFENVPFCVEI